MPNTLHYCEETPLSPFGVYRLPVGCFEGTGCIPFFEFMPGMGIIAHPAQESIAEPTLP